MKDLRGDYYLLTKLVHDYPMKYLIYLQTQQPPRLRMINALGLHTYRQLSTRRFLVEHPLSFPLMFSSLNKSIIKKYIYIYH